MKTRRVCRTCRGQRSVANFAYPGHIEACPCCDASGYVAIADSKTVPHTNASASPAANDIGSLRKRLNETRKLLTSVMITLTSWSELFELTILAGV